MSVQVEHLSFSYCTRPVLEDICFSLAPGQLLAVLGPNGVGKSTLFRCILGLQSRYAGRVLINGQDSRNLSRRDLAHQVAYIPQVHTLAFNYTVLEMVLMGTSHQVSAFSAPGKKQEQAALMALDQAGVSHLAGKQFSHLSGGEQQLVLIARALAQHSPILIMDEPTANLDFGHQSQVLDQARALADQGYIVIFSTHHPQQALSHADAALALLDHRVVAWGPPQEALTGELIRRLYQVDVAYVDSEFGRVLTPRGRLA